ncbi:kinase-like domain-containing protein [Rhizophagus clarus]|uniref:Kinase-like domain-containing protein n=1 Tax=Rhizophagus clarus TaxID=94130 RepID=A0A8H3QDM3_9GLOM|nr:kinase-like domain-containing protein [Rhizophagus clarus]
MNYFNGDKQYVCFRCKQVSDTNSKYCEACISKNWKEKYGKCMECQQIITAKEWCQTCNSKRFQRNFDNWTSGNDEVDKFIQDTQLSAKNCFQVLEWIPYDRFNKPKLIGEGGFGKVYRASWKDGYITHWDTSCNQWKRCKEKYNFVALKTHLKVHRVKAPLQVIKCHGISQDPITKEYIMVMNYAKNGNLQTFLKEKRKDLCKTNKWPLKELDFNLRLWKYKLGILYNISSELYKIHGKGLIHRDLHIGNIVCNSLPCITDMGLCKPANYHELNNKEKKGPYGVESYLAPEILRGENYTQASDIYSLGIIIYEVISELPPYYNISTRDRILAVEICEGLRPEFNIKVPQLILHLIKRCLDADPLNRPSTSEISRTFHEWLTEFNKYCENRLENEEAPRTELIKQIEETEKINNENTKKINNSSSNNSSLTNETIYKSRLLNFKNLPEPKNSNDYYENYENILSKIYSGIKLT